MGGGAGLAGIEHVQQPLIVSKLQQEIFPLGLVGQLTREQFFPKEGPEGDSVDPLSQSLFLCHFLFIFLLSLEDVVSEGADSIIGMQGLEDLVVLVLDPHIIPLRVVFHAIRLEKLLELLGILLFDLIRLVSFFLGQLIKVSLEGILFFVLLKQSPPRIRHKVIGHLMHLALGGQFSIFLEHLDKLNPVDLSLGLLFLIADLLEFSDVLIEVLLFITDLQQLPSIIIFTELDAGVPFGAGADEFLLQKSHELPLYLLGLRKRLFFHQLAFLLILPPLLLQLNAVFLDLIWQLPARFPGSRIVIELFSLCSSILLPIWMLENLLSSLKALRHLIL